jgi:REP element-mobilizing transposase RayT
MEYKHLKRLDRIWITNPRYFITVCVDKRRPVLADVVVAEVLLSEWKSAFEQHGWAIGSYVIMPDHVHFFCTDSEQGVVLSTFIKRWKEWTSKRLKREVGLAGFAWQKGFFDHLLRSSESYSEKWDYVRQNPVRAGLVRVADEWPYWGHIHYL